jgi:hypothetical protein
MTSRPKESECHLCVEEGVVVRGRPAAQHLEQLLVVQALAALWGEKARVCGGASANRAPEGWGARLRGVRRPEGVHGNPLNRERHSPQRAHSSPCRFASNARTPLTLNFQCAQPNGALDLKSTPNIPAPPGPSHTPQPPVSPSSAFVPTSCPPSNKAPLPLKTLPSPPNTPPGSRPVSAPWWG